MREDLNVNKKVLASDEKKNIQEEMKEKSGNPIRGEGH